MLTRMHLTLRTFENEEIWFAPLTVLVGPNGAGKSTILHALAMLTQSWISRAPEPLVLNGPWVELGEFESLAPKGYAGFFLEWNWLAQQQGIEFVVQKHRNKLQVCRDRFRYYHDMKAYSLPSQVEPLHFSFAPSAGPSPLTEELLALSYVNSGLSSLLLGVHYLSARLYPVCAEYESFILPVGSVGPNASYLVSFLACSPSVVSQINQFLNSRNIAPIEIRRSEDGRYVIYRCYPDANVSVELASDGSGYLNLIPVLAELFGASNGDTILLEQPEAHLHPQLALHIADAVISAVHQGKSVFLETHSEEIVLRLRRRIAEGVISPDQVVVYFVYRTGKESHLTRIEFDQTGRPNPGWPDGFWGEDHDEALHLARCNSKPVPREIAARLERGDRMGKTTS